MIRRLIVEVETGTSDTVASARIVGSVMRIIAAEFPDNEDFWDDVYEALDSAGVPEDAPDDVSITVREE